MHSSRKRYLPLLAAVAVLCGTPAARAQDPVELFKDAQDLENQGLHNEALDRLERAYDSARAESQRLTIQTAIGLVLFKLGRADEARGRLEDVLLRGGSSDNRSRSLFGLGRILQQQGKLPEALARYDDALKEDPAPEIRQFALLLSGDILLQQGWLDAAQSRLEEVVNLPDRSGSQGEALVRLGLVFDRKGRPEDALKALDQGKRVARNRETQAWALITSGDILWTACRTDEAEKEFQAAQPLAPDGETKAKAFLGLGNILSDRKRPLEAVAVLQQGLKYASTPDTKFTLLYNLGESFLDIGRTTDAESSFRQSIAAATRSDERLLAQTGIGSVLLRKGRVGEAKALFRHILSEYRRMAADLSLPEFRAYALLEAGDLLARVERKPDEAIESLTQGLKLIANQRMKANGLAALADLELRAGHTQTALAHYTESSAISCSGQQKAEALLAAGDALRRLGKLDDAVAALTQGLALATDAGSRRFGYLRLANIAFRRRPYYILLGIVLLGVSAALLYGRLLRRFCQAPDSSYGRSIALRAPLAGALGALIGSIPQIVFDYFNLDTASLVARGSVSNLLSGAVNEVFSSQFLRIEAISSLLAAATVVAVSLAGAPDPSAKKLAKASALGTLLGFIGIFAYDLIWYGFEAHPVSPVHSVLLLAACSGAMGLAIGLAAGLASGSGRRVAFGAAGGFLGGGLGGLAFYPVHAMLLDVLPFDNVVSYTGLLQHILLGAAIGFALALVEIPARRFEAAVSKEPRDLRPERPGLVGQVLIARSGASTEPSFQLQELLSVSTETLEVSVIRPVVASRVALTLLAVNAETCNGGKETGVDDNATV